MRDSEDESYISPWLKPRESPQHLCLHSYTLPTGPYLDKHAAKLAQEAKASMPLLHISLKTLGGGLDQHMNASDCPLQSPLVCPNGPEDFLSRLQQSEPKTHRRFAAA